MQEERRQRLRIRQSFHATYRRIEGPAQSWCSTGPVNLSLSGARFRGSQQLDPGCLIELAILPPKAVHPFTLRARVVWDKAYPSGVLEYGIAFVDVTPDQERQLEKLIGSLPKDQPKT